MGEDEQDSWVFVKKGLLTSSPTKGRDPSANRSIILRWGGYGLCCARGLAAITSVADCRDDGRIVPVEQGAPEEIFVREKHALRLQFSSVAGINPNDSI